MITFRYHLVSVVAVFLAVGLGVLIGTTVLDQGIVATLRDRTETLSADLDQLRGRVSELETGLDRMEDFGDEILPYLVGGRLLGVPVVVVTQEGVDEATVGEARKALELSGAELVAVVSAADRMAARDRTAREELAALLGLPAATEPDQLMELAARALAVRLADGGPPLEVGAEGAPPPPDLLRDLLSAGFLVSRGPTLSDADLPGVGGGQVVLVLGGGDGEPALEPGAFLVPLVEALAARGVPVAAGESANTNSEYPFVPLLRTESEVAGDGTVLTVDDVDEVPGGVALVLGLEDLLTLGRGGDYGFKDGATSLIPRP